MSFTCPVCHRTSYHPEDEQWGYCGNCHDYTGGYGYGDKRYCSRSTPAGSEGEMRMPTNDEDGKAQPEMPEVQGQGISGSLRDVQWERMECKDESLMSQLQRDGIHAPIPPKPITERYHYPLTSRDIMAFISVGVSCGVSIGTMLYFRMTRHHAVIVSTSIIVTIALYQTAYMLSAMRRMKRRKKEYDAAMETFAAKYGLKREE
jgi:hypothetical protein